MKSAAVAAGVSPANSTVAAGVSPAKTQQSTLNNCLPSRSLGEGWSRRSARIGFISLLANHANKKFFHALTSQSYETHPNFSTANSTPVSHSGLRAGYQELPSC